jgi:hypothetical protein
MCRSGVLTGGVSRRAGVMIGRNAWRFLAALVAALALPALADAQYFGRNKVQYRTFDFQILPTQHFDLYYYPSEREAAEIASRLAERWYARLSRFFDHQLRSRQVLILYATAEDFRQTNAIEGVIGEGTGGVTETIKRRMVLPMAGSLAETNHVIGHELVHAFQFDITGADPREGSAGTGPGILDYPLWFVEGMAEYLSLGPVDAQTAMWMRDAALREKLPKISDLEKPEYFPYRWGHSFWAFVGSKFGDRTVASLVRSAANPRYDLVGLARQLGTDPDKLTDDWHKAILASAATVSQDRPSVESTTHRIIARDQAGGRYNVGPRVSPDGRQVAFFTDHGRFSMELYLADAATGHIERTLIKTATDPHFDSLQFLYSAGAWSPDGKTLAVSAVHSGKAVMVLVNARNGSVIREVPLPGLDDALNPSYSTDGKSIVFSGNRGGLVDLFLLSLESGKMDELTHDPFADLEPTFTPDGHAIIFVTERYSIDLTTLDPGPLRLARLDLATHEVTPIAAFLKGKQISPQISSDGQSLTFIAEPDGVSNLFRMPIDGGPIMQISSFVTGVAGITATSPAFSESESGRLTFSVFEDGGHSIYTMDPSDIVMTVAREADSRAAVLTGTAPPTGDVQKMLADQNRGLPAAGTAPASHPYNSHMTLDMLGQPTISVGIAGRVGGFVSGGMSAYFSDMLGDHLLSVSGTVSSSYLDFGGQVAYVNRQHRWNWGLVADATPYRVDQISAANDFANNHVVLTDAIHRQQILGGMFFTALPLDQARRIELSAGAQSIFSSVETKVATYDGSSLRLLSTTSVRVPADITLHLAQTSAAYVYDTSLFGAIDSIFGQRYRLEVDQIGGTLNYTGLLADFRRYFMPKRPITVAVRALHYGRYGADSEDPRLVQLYAGYPELVHGYGFGSFTPADCYFVGAVYQCTAADNLIGSRMLVGNLEVRAPLLGLFRGDLQYGQVPVEVAAFADAGVTWTRLDLPTFLGGDRSVLRSVGGAVRVNIFGFLPLELSAAKPLDRLYHSWQWQLGIRTGF